MILYPGTRQFLPDLRVPNYPGTRFNLTVHRWFSDSVIPAYIIPVGRLLGILQQSIWLRNSIPSTKVNISISLFSSTICRIVKTIKYYTCHGVLRRHRRQRCKSLRFCDNFVHHPWSQLSLILRPITLAFILMIFYACRTRKICVKSIWIIRTLSLYLFV